MSAAFWTRLDALEQAEARNVDARASTALMLNAMFARIEALEEQRTTLRMAIDNLMLASHPPGFGDRLTALEAEAERRKGGRPRKVEEAA